jgi:hypothetical protein
MIGRKSNSKSIILDIVATKPNDSSTYLLSNIKNNLDNILLSEWDAVCAIPNTGTRNHYHGRGKLPIPFYDESSSCDLVVSQEEAVRRLGMQYVDISTKPIPNDSTIAFGSGYYSNDEQKAFALKYDCSVAKAPSKTQYYVLSSEEERSLNHIVKYPQGMMKAAPIKAVIATPHAIKNALERHFLSNQAAIKDNIVKLLVNTRSMDSSGAVSRGNYQHSPYEAILETIKYGYLGPAYTSPYSDLKIEEITGRGRVLNSPHFVFDWGWSNRILRGVDVPKSNTPTGYAYNVLYNVPMLYMSFMSDPDILDLKNGPKLEMPLAQWNEWQARWERKSAGQYYGNSYGLNSGSFSSDVTPAKLEIDLLDTEHYEVINTDKYIALETHFDSLDRLFGFLSENPDITVVSESAFVSQLKQSNPTLNLTTYDSLYGMFRSEDQNTRKTASKMLQSFDLPELAPDQNYNGSIWQNSEEPKSYALHMAMDLVANSNVTGASLNKWVQKKVGETLTSLVNSRSRTRHGYASTPYQYGVNNYRRTFCGFNEKDAHPAMPYDDRAKWHEIVHAINELVPAYFDEQTKHMPKYFNAFTTSIVKNKTFEAYTAMYVDLTSREDSLNQEEKINLGYLQLFMRHYVEYTFTRYYLGQSNNISYDLNVKCAADIPAAADAKLMNSIFGEYKKKFIQAKAKALANPVKYMEILIKNETDYRVKYIHSLSGYRSELIADYANQSFLLGFPKNIITQGRPDVTVQSTEILDVFDYYIANL